MKHTELLKELAKLAGVPDDKLTVIDGEELTDEIVQPIKNNLLTLESAKHNTQLKSYYTANALDAVDSKLSALFDGASDDLKTKLTTTKSTFEKLGLIDELIETKVKTVSDELKKGVGSKDKSIEELNNQILDLKKNHDSIIKNKESEIVNFKTNTLLDLELSNFNYTNDQIPKKVNITTAKTLLNESLRQKNLSIQLDDEGISLRQSDGSKLYEQNKEVQLKDFVTKTLTDNGLLKVSTPSPQPPPHKGTTVPRTTELPRGAETLISRMEERLANYNGKQ